jgi:SAM-dependent methyltransferase
MSESIETLEAIHSYTKGNTLLVGRKIGQTKFNIFEARLRVEAKPLKYATGGNVIAWKAGLLSKFEPGDFDSIILHRFLYKRVKEYIEDPVRVVAEVKRILPEGGELVVNSFLLDDATRSFRSSDSFFTEAEMSSLLETQSFRKVSRVGIKKTAIFICEK